MAYRCTLLPLLIVLLMGPSLSPPAALALEFMEDGALANDEAHPVDEGEFSAEAPALSTGYTRDTIAHFNPRKSNAGYRQLWERIPQQKVDVIKRR
ncbi:uncharacterized protein LOC111071628 [Drosophila obscura]|uniref:uncharacterized protein LOC111071628 n=1 Tax=Drosophila obscura TaxID=7282 RepID=UPI001BB1DBF2|nr:uncharacterized protein LOC111071628 [Drosophila obscura]